MNETAITTSPSANHRHRYTFSQPSSSPSVQLLPGLSASLNHAFISFVNCFNRIIPYCSIIEFIRKKLTCAIFVFLAYKTNFNTRAINAVAYH